MGLTIAMRVGMTLCSHGNDLQVAVNDFLRNFKYTSSVFQKISIARAGLSEARARHSG
jgi:hypothetical protein